MDEHDREIGTSEKIAAHRAPGVLHRAVSVVVFDQADAVLIQQRALDKHHFAGRWSNSCCTHPAPGESPLAAGRRRMMEEMGVTVVLRPVGTFIYRAEDPVSRLVEHELDHVLTGTIDRSVEPRPDPTEVAAWEWRAVADLQHDLAARPERYTPWFAEVLRLAHAG